MPELPEVETVRRGLAPAMRGATIVRVEQRRRDLRFPFPANFARRLVNRTISALDRRAKYLLAPLDDNEVLVMHLGMSGRFTITPGVVSDKNLRLGEFVHSQGGNPAHDHVVLHLSNGAVITYNDPRRFGFMDLIPEHELTTHKFFSGLGPEPLSNEFEAVTLARRAAGRKTDLKTFLLDQRVVAGLGNIYVCEALFRARLSPNRRAASLATKAGLASRRGEDLVRAIRAVLEDAIEAGGSSLRDYRHTDGALGYFQHRFHVYGREGEPCKTPSCRGIVRRSVRAGRSTFSCPVCQR